MLFETELATHVSFESADVASLAVDASALLHELFEKQVDARRTAAAIITDHASLSYAHVEEHSNLLAHLLRDLNVGPGTLVGIFFQRSELPIMALLGCLKAGGAYLPMEPGHPDARIRYIVEEAEITVLLTEQALLDRAKAIFAGRIIALDACGRELAKQPRRRLSAAETKVSAHDLTYIIYTSGSTGRPKGVMTEHRNIQEFVTAFNKVCTTGPDDRIYQGFPLGFDGSVEEIWMAFSNGAALVVGSHETPRFGDELARYMTERKISYFSTVPTVLATMREDVPSLTQLVLSGEVCPPELVARGSRPGLRLLNVYGPTEATVNTTATLCEPGREVTVGRVLRGYSAIVLDEQMRPLPPNTAGELYIGGTGIARGYIRILRR